MLRKFPSEGYEALSLSSVPGGTPYSFAQTYSHLWRP